MKKLFCVLAIFAMAACSSTKEEAEDTAATTMEQTNETMEATADSAKETMKDAKETMTSTKEEAMSSDGGGGDFPAITGTEKSSLSCANGGDTRKVSVLNVTEGGCGVVYSKHGVDKTVALAKFDMSYCDKVSGNIKGNLEGAGFNCGGGGEATTTEQPAATESGSSTDTE